MFNIVPANRGSPERGVTGLEHVAQQGDIFWFAGSLWGVLWQKNCKTEYSCNA